jgi:4'-phosphopantetheinyl transferase
MQGEIHVWRAWLDGCDSQQLSRTLSAEERARAEKFHRSEDRHQFIAARGLLRRILGRYLKIAPEDLRFCYGSHGKPALEAGTSGQALHFNLAHSRGLALYAIALGHEVGVDLEYVCQNLKYKGIAERFFSAREYADLCAFPAGEQRRVFFNYWTHKEAFVKATGEGLAYRLDEFEISAGRGNATLLSIRDDRRAARHWTLLHLNPAPDYVASIAAKGRGWRLRCWHE